MDLRTGIRRLTRSDWPVLRSVGRWARVAGIAVGLAAAGGCGGSGGDGGEAGESFSFESDAGVSGMLTPEAGGTVTAADGKLSIIAPPGAVSEALEITVHVMTSADAPDVIAYELLPHGTTFEVPVIMRRVLTPDQAVDTSLDLQRMIIPSPVIYSEQGDPELTANTTAVFDPPTGNLTIDTELLHFSTPVYDGEPLGPILPSQIVAPAEAMGGDPEMRPEIDVCVGDDVSISFTVTIPETADLDLDDDRAFRDFAWVDPPRLDLQTALLDVVQTTATGPLTLDMARDGFDFVFVEIPTGATDPNVPGDLLVFQSAAAVCSEPGTGSLGATAFGGVSGAVVGRAFTTSAQERVTDDGSRSYTLSRDGGERDVSTPVSREAWAGHGVTVNCIPCGDTPLSCNDEDVDTSSVEQVGQELVSSSPLEDGLHCASDMPVPKSDGVGVDAGAGDHTQFAAVGGIETSLAQAIRVAPEGDAALLPCGAQGESLVVCADPTAMSSGGDAYAMVSVMQGPVPQADVINLYQYGWVFDSDGDPSKQLFSTRAVSVRHVSEHGPVVSAAVRPRDGMDARGHRRDRRRPDHDPQSGTSGHRRQRPRAGGAAQRDPARRTPSVHELPAHGGLWGHAAVRLQYRRRADRRRRATGLRGHRHPAAPRGLRTQHHRDHGHRRLTAAR